MCRGVYFFISSGVHFLHNREKYILLGEYPLVVHTASIYPRRLFALSSSDKSFDVDACDMKSFANIHPLKSWEEYRPLTQTQGDRSLSG